MKKFLVFTILLFSLTFEIFSQNVPGYSSTDYPPTSFGKHFTHIALSSTNSANYTTIDNPATNDKPNARLFITHNWNRSGSGVYNDKVSGLWYKSSANKWTIFDQGSNPIIENSAYDIWVVDAADSMVFQHTARSYNTSSNYTIINHPKLDGKPNAAILVTQILIDTAGNTYNDHEIGVWYTGSNWSVFNQDGSAMPDGASFNVMILTDQNSLLHKATTGNITAAVTYIDNPYLNNNPQAIIYVTQNWNPGGGSGTYNTSKIGTFYSTTQNKWTIYNEDQAAMVENSNYNVYIGSPYFVHKTNSDNISGDLTVFNNPLINTDSSARVFALHNWNPYNSGTSTFNKELGVYNNGSVWGIYTEDGSDIPENVYFNVAIAPKTDSAFLHTTTASNISGGNYTTIDNPLLNNNPSARILIQHQFQSSRDTSYLGLWYNSGTAKWTIFHEDHAVMPANKHYNVWLLDNNKSFVHNVDSSNIQLSLSYSVLDNPLTNNDPDANILITPLLNGGSYFDHVIGVWYYDVTGRWYLYTEDGTAFVEDLKYIVHVASKPAIPTSIDEENNPAVVSNFELYQNYPNPFNPSTQIKFAITEQSQVSLKVYNILGKEIATLVNDVRGAGIHEVNFDGTGLASGVYFYTLQAGKFSQTNKMILIK